MTAVSLTEGTLFAGRYRIVGCIAAGGMGAVYEVTHVETERRRALKVMHPHFLQSQELRDRFRQEARVAAHIESDFIVDVFDAGIDDATQMPFLVMELLKGEEIGRLLSRRGRLTPAEVVTYLHQTALALDKTHKAQIVHRDLKPENLFLTEREDGLPRIKILDFGIAKVVADSGTQVNATRSIGTPLYMAPEQFNPGHRVSPAADLYALSMLAYTLLVGRTYWAEEADGGNVFAFAGVAMRGPPESASARAHRAGVRLPPEIDAWFSRATAFHPEERFPTATATVAALAGSLGLPAPGVGASGPQSAVAAQTQLLGMGDASAFATSRPSIGTSHSGPGSGLHSSGHAGLHSSGPGSGLHSSGSGSGLHSSGPGSGLRTSGVGNLGGTVAGAQTGPRSPVLARIGAGLMVCLVTAGAAAYWLWPHLAPPVEAPAAAAAQAEPPPASAAAPVVEPSPAALPTTTAVGATPPQPAAQKPPRDAVKPSQGPVPPRPKKAVHARD